VQEEFKLDYDVFWVAKSFNFSEGLIDELKGLDPLIKSQILKEDDVYNNDEMDKFNALVEKRNKKML